MADKPETCGEMEDDTTFLPDFENVNQFVQQTLKAVLQGTKSSNEMPAAGDDFDYFSSFQGFQDVMNFEGKRVLHLMQSVLKHQGVKANLGTSGGAADIEDKLEVLMDANDQILERVGGWLDEASGIKKQDENTLVIATATPKQTPSASWNKKSPGSSTPKTASFKLLSARNILRPQLKFKDKVENGHTPFIPVIKHKPHAKKTLEESLKLPEDVTPERSEEPTFSHPHPYQYELDQLSHPPSQLSAVQPRTPGDLESTPLVIVTDPQALANLVEGLKQETEIAVDLEHHSYRTFQGITCLIQISTRSCDYLVDAIELRSNLSILNEVFTDPSIVKVFHGSESDIDWLQRDFGVYVVNMFDTGQASRIMNMSRFSLAHLMQHYCDVTPDKQYQLADWRIRPLPEELLNYAREDTHYLLYIYDRMKNELLERGNEAKNLLLAVLQRSALVCARVYKKPLFTDASYSDLYKKNKRIFNSRQMCALQELFTWRDQTARLEDESYGYVLPNHMLLQICDILPRENQGVLACCNPIPPLVRQYLSDIHKIIMKARDVPLNKVVSARKPVSGPTPQQHPKYNVDSLLNCPHDLSHADRAAAIKPQSTLLDGSLISEQSVIFRGQDIPDSSLTTLLAKPRLSAFDSTAKSRGNLTETQKKVAEIKGEFVSPYTQFLPVDALTGVVKPVMTIDLSKSKPQQSSPTKPWVLMQGTQKRKDPDTSITDSPLTTGPPQKRSRTDLREPTHLKFDDDGEVIEVDDRDEEEKEDDKKALPQDLEIPLRFQMQTKKKNKKNRNRDVDIMESVQKHLQNIRKIQEQNERVLGHDTEEMEETVPPRQQGSKSNTESGRKRSVQTTVTIESDDEEEETSEKAKKEFKPFDYAEGAKGLLKGERKDKLDYYSPMGRGGKRNKGSKGKSKMQSKKGNKSYTWKDKT